MLAGRRRRLAGTPTTRGPDDRDAASMVKADDPDASWGPRHVVRAGDGTTVGSIGFFGAPVARPTTGCPRPRSASASSRTPAATAPSTEALSALLAEVDRVGVRVRASVRPENAASLRVLAKCRFTQLRGSTEDGELVMVRPLPPAQPVDEP